MDNDFSYKNFFSTLGIYSHLFENTKNSWEALPKISDFISEFKNNLPEGFREIKEGLYVGENVQINEFSKIEGRAIIGKNSHLGHAAYLRGDVLIGENVNIGHAVEVKHSIILDNTAIAHLNYVGDSIVGNNVNISGGTILANFRLDQKKVGIKLDGSFIETNLEKLGSIIGDNSRIGVNSVLNPGTVLGKNTIVYPLVSVSGYFKDNSIIKV